MNPVRPWKLRALLFLYSNGNLAGCALALAGPLLLFAGVIGPGWLWITAGLYLGGLALGGALGASPEVEREIAGHLDASEILAHLDAVVAAAVPHLPQDTAEHLRSIRRSVEEVLPRLQAGASHSSDLFTVRETVLRYLPETLSNYLSLPPAYRVSHVLSSGKTARAHLGEQLALLDGQLLEVVANVSAADAQALLANGQFLRNRFGEADFLN